MSNFLKNLEKFFSGSLGGSILGAGGSILSGLISNSQNKKMMREQNQFNAAEAEKNRQFQSQESEIARQWQEDFYNQYQSPEAMVRQYENAGMNPVLATGHATNTPPAATSSSGSMAQGVGPGYLNSAAIMEQFARLTLMRAEIDNIKSQTDLNKQQVFESISRENLNGQIKLLTKEQQTEVVNRANLLAAQAKTESAKREWYIVEKALKQATQKHIDYENALSDSFFELTGQRVPTSTLNMLLEKTVDIATFVLKLPKKR